MNTKSPLISIILPVFNGEEFLAQSIKSCLAQSYRNIELLIVNDCSTDSSLEIAESFASKDQRLKIISNERNLNLPASLNIGHRFAKGEFFTWTSDDNFYERNALEVMFNKISNGLIDIVHTNFNVIDKNGNLRANKVLSSSSTILLGNTVGSCFLYKRKVYNEIGGYDESLHTIEDFDFWLQASVQFQNLYIPLKLYNYRVHEKTLSSKIKFKNSDLQESFKHKLEFSYSKFFKQYGIDEKEYPRIFKYLHLNLEFNVYDFLINYDHFRRSLNPVFMKFGEKKILKEIDLKVRSNIYNYKRNQNAEVLFLVLKKRPSILLQYSKRKSLKIISKCLFKI